AAKRFAANEKYAAAEFAGSGRWWLQPGRSAARGGARQGGALPAILRKRGPALRHFSLRAGVRKWQNRGMCKGQPLFLPAQASVFRKAPARYSQPDLPAAQTL